MVTPAFRLSSEAIRTRTRDATRTRRYFFLTFFLALALCSDFQLYSTLPSVAPALSRSV